MRFVAAIAVVVLALVIAVGVRQGTVWRDPARVCAGQPFAACSAYQHPSWENPAAAALAIGGVLVAVAILVAGQRRRPDPLSSATLS